MIGNRQMIWKTSMWTQWFVENSWLSLFKLQFILDQIIQWLCDSSKNNLRRLWNNYSGQLRGWSKSRRRRQECLRSTGTSVCRESSLLCDRAVRVVHSKNLRLFRLGALLGRHQSRTSSSLERQNQKVFGNSPSQRIGSNWWRTHRIRVEKFPRTHCIGYSRRDSKVDDWITVWTSAISKAGSSSCQCTTTLHEDKKIMNIVWWNSEDDGRIKVWTWAMSRKDHLHVHVQWHCMV